MQVVRMEEVTSVRGKREVPRLFCADDVGGLVWGRVAGVCEALKARLIPAQGASPGLRYRKEAERCRRDLSRAQSHRYRACVAACRL